MPNDGFSAIHVDFDLDPDDFEATDSTRRYAYEVELFDAYEGSAKLVVWMTVDGERIAHSTRKIPLKRFDSLMLKVPIRAPLDRAPLESR